MWKRVEKGRIALQSIHPRVAIFKRGSIICSKGEFDFNHHIIFSSGVLCLYVYSSRPSNNRVLRTDVFDRHAWLWEGKVGRRYYLVFKIKKQGGACGLSVQTTRRRQKTETNRLKRVGQMCNEEKRCRSGENTCLTHSPSLHPSPTPLASDQADQAP